MDRMKRTRIDHVEWQGEVTNVLIEGNRFRDLHAPNNAKADLVIDGTGKALLPPFYNSHTHAAMTLLRGYADDMPLFPWLNDYIWPYEAHLQPEDIYAGSRLAILEMIKSGCVFFSDMYWDISQTIRATEEMGIRASIGVTFMDRLSEETKEYNRRFLREWTGTASGRISLNVAPHAIYTASESLLRQCGQLAEECHDVLHIHLSETEQEVNDCVRLHGMTPVHWLDHLGLLTDHTVVAHAVWVDSDETDLMARRGVTAVHCPCSNMKLSSGTFPYARFIQSGCRVALGTDGASSNNSLDLHQEMKFAALLSKLNNEPTTLPAEEIFCWATRSGAEAYGIDAGVIAEGRLADALLIRLDDHRMVPCHHLLSNWVYSADNAAIDTVICNGLVVMDGGHVPHEADIVAQARAACRRIAARM